MHRATIVVSALFLAALQLGAASNAFAQEPVLEVYTLGQGGNQTSNLSGLTVNLSDDGFGASPGIGSASSRLRLSTADSGSTLFLRVFRNLPPGSIAFALLVDRVEVRAFNSSGTLVYSRDLAGFTIPDSSSGNWSRTLSDLPASVAELRVSFFGNYE